MVYVVIGEVDYHGDSLISIWESWGKAVKEMDRLRSLGGRSGEPNTGYDDYRVDEYKVGA